MDFVDQAITNAAQRALHLGYHELRPNQFKAVRAFVEGRDVFLALPLEVESHYATRSVLPYAFDELTSRKG